MPPWEQFAVKAAGEKWDKTRLAAKYENTPPKSPDLNRLPQDVRKFHKLYDQLNPDWRKGLSIAIISPINVKTMFHAFRRAVKRFIRLEH